jgi:Flp pilus assembly protein TadG
VRNVLVWIAWRSRLRAHAASVARDQSGLAAVELALLAPILIVVAVCTAELGMGVYRKMQVENAAQAGAAYAAVRGFNAAAIETAVAAANPSVAIAATPAPRQFCGCATGVAIEEVACSASCDSGLGAGTYAQVSAQGSYTPHLLLPLMQQQSFVFSAQTTVRLQ